MTDIEIRELLDIGLSLSAEKDYNRLLEKILKSAMELAECDAGTLYLRDGDVLKFCIIRNHTMHSYEGGDGTPPGLPPVKIDRGSVCALSLLENITICVDDVYHCSKYDFSGPLRYDAMTGYKTTSMLVVPMRDREDEVLGILQLINALDENGHVVPFRKITIDIIESVASQAAISVQNKRYVEAIRGLFHSFVQVLSCAIDERTPYNVSHTKNMVLYGGRFLDYLNRLCEEEGKEPPFTPGRREEFLMSVWLHDIGKLVTPLEIMNKAARLLPEELERIMYRFEIIGLKNEIALLKGKITQEQETEQSGLLKSAKEIILTANTCGFLQDELLNNILLIGNQYYNDENDVPVRWLSPGELHKLTIRKGTLTAEERRSMENHVTVTARLLSKISFIREYSHVPMWASSHHELLNGSGYPGGLSGDEIPCEVRILTILDIFDALTADDRPYKPGLPTVKAISILKDMAVKEHKLDETLTELFIRSHCWENTGGHESKYASNE